MMRERIRKLYVEKRKKGNKCTYLVLAKHYHFALRYELNGVASIGSEEVIEWYEGMTVIVLDTVDDVLLIG